MKNLFRIYLPLLIFLIALGILFLGYVITNHAGILKYFAGEAGLEGKGKIITTQVKAVFKEDDVEQNRVKVLQDNGKFYLVFEKTEDLDLDVLIVDKARKDIYVPVVGYSCYDFLFSTYLFEAECAQRGDYYLSLRKGMYNVRFTSTDSQINFQLPAEYNNGKVIKNRQMEILFKAE